MVAHVHAGGVPMAVPLSCLKTISPKAKKLFSKPKWMAAFSASGSALAERSLPLRGLKMRGKCQRYRPYVWSQQLSCPRRACNPSPTNYQKAGWQKKCPLEMVIKIYVQVHKHYVHTLIHENLNAIYRNIRPASSDVFILIITRFRTLMTSLQ